MFLFFVFCFLFFIFYFLPRTLGSCKQSTRILLVVRLLLRLLLEGHPVLMLLHLLRHLLMLRHFRVGARELHLAALVHTSHPEPAALHLRLQLLIQHLDVALHGVARERLLRLVTELHQRQELRVIYHLDAEAGEDGSVGLQLISVDERARILVRLPHVAAAFIALALAAPSALRLGDAAVGVVTQPLAGLLRLCGCLVVGQLLLGRLVFSVLLSRQCGLLSTGHAGHLLGLLVLHDTAP